MMESPEGWANIWTQFAANLEAGWSWSGFERSAFFLNTGGAHYEDIATVLGADQVSDGRGLAAGDIDNDGDLDLVGTVSRVHPHAYVLRNDLPQAGNHVFLELIPSEHRSPAGAIALATANGVTQRRDVAVGAGYLTQHDLTLHFGLADAEVAERIEITWPDGEQRVLENVVANRKLVVRQGVDEITEIQHGARNANATARLPEVEWDSYGDRLRLLERPYPDISWLTIPGPEGEQLSLVVGEAGAKRGGPAILVNLWATWCANCKREMPDLVRAAQENPGGLQIVGLAMDAEEDAELVQATMERWGMDFPVRHLTGSHMGLLMRALSSELGSESGESLALPTSLLLTPNGKVIGIAQGAIDIENIARFLDSVRE